jgi:hypothetical protein
MPGGSFNGGVVVLGIVGPNTTCFMLGVEVVLRSAIEVKFVCDIVGTVV